MLVIPSVPRHEWVSSETGAKKLLDACMGAEIVCIDTETDTLEKTKARAIIWSLAIKGRRVALPRSVLDVFKPFFLSSVPKTMHNAPYDRHVIENTCGVRMKGPIYDTKPMAVMNNTEMPNYRLKFLASDGLFDPYDPRYIKYEEIFRGKLKTTTEAIRVLGLPAVANYASLDAHSGLTVFEELRKQLQNTESIYDNTLWDIYQEEEVIFSDVLYECERNGILIDVEYLKEKAEIAQGKINELSEEFVSRARAPINLRSPKQLSEFFYGTLGRPIKKRTKGGKTGKTAPSVDDSVLQAWAKEGDPYARILIEYRSHSKVKSTYLDGLVEAADKNGRVHTTLNQAGARTGRLSSDSPNLQNIPRAGEEGDIYLIRSAFMAPEGQVLIDADYDQLEMRIMAELAGEESMIEMINKGWDVHTANASLIFGVEYEDVIEAVKEKKAVEKAGKGGISERVSTLCAYRQKIKCVAKGTLVYTPKGLFPIEALVNTRAVGEFSSLQQEVYADRDKEVLATEGYYQGKRKTKKVLLKNGMVLEGSSKHRVRIIDTNGDYVWRKLDELCEGDWIAINKKPREQNKEIIEIPFAFWRGKGEDTENYPKVPITEDWAYLFGYLTGDGHITDKYFTITAGKDYIEEQEHIEGVLNRLGITYSKIVQKARSKRSTKAMGTVTYSTYAPRLCEFLQFCGVKKSSRKNKVPWPVLRSPKKVVYAFLRAYFECDGSSGASLISCSSARREFLMVLQQVLLFCGMTSTIRPTWNALYNRNYYNLRICGDSRRRFIREIGFISSRKNARCKMFKQGTDKIPNQSSKARELMDSAGYKLRALLRPVANRDWELTVHSLGKARSLGASGETVDYWDFLSSFGFSRVESIEDGEAELFDLSVPEGNSYIANGFFSHNTIGFGLNYGQGPSAFAASLNCSIDEAKDLIAKYFERFPKIQKYISDMHEVVEEKGLVFTMSGRIRHISAGFSNDHGKLAEAHRVATNSTVQGTAADIVRLAMIYCHRNERLRELEAKMLLQVHDELVFQCPEETAEEAAPIVKEMMQLPYKDDFSVKITATPEIGKRWTDVH